MAQTVRNRQTGSDLEPQSVYTYRSEGISGGPCGGYPGFDLSSTVNWSTREYSSMIDCIGDYNRKLPARTVYHTKWKYDVKAPFLPSYGVCNTLWTFNGSAGLPASVRDTIMSKASAPDSEWWVFNDEAFISFNAQMPTEVSLANFMWELRELKDLIPKITGRLQDVVANSYLTLEFGWLPLIGDLQKLYRIGETVKSRLDYLLARWGKNTHLGAYKKVVLTPSPIDPVPLNAFANLALGVDIEQCTITYRAGGYMFHTLEWVKSARAEWHALAGALGFLDPLAIVWEAIPYSFVVDWVFDMDSWINRYGHIVEEPEHWSIYGLCTSRKKEVKARIFQVNQEGSYNISRFPNREIGTFSSSVYERLPGLPTSPVFDRASFVTPKQLALLAALGVGHT